MIVLLSVTVTRYVVQSTHRFKGLAVARAPQDENSQGQFRFQPCPRVAHVYHAVHAVRTPFYELQKGGVQEGESTLCTKNVL